MKTDEWPPHEPFVAFAEQLADCSRAMLLEASKHLPEVTLKSDASFVTETDKAVERQLRELIVDKYPEHGIFGEEFESYQADADFIWVLDPIDGTAAYVAGIPVYGTLIGLAWNTKPFVGVMDHPITADRWTGVSDRFARHNREAIQVRQGVKLSNAYATCSNPDFMSDDELSKFALVRDQVTYMQYGGSCFSYGILASGRSDLAIDSGLEAFDIFASAAVISGAGGQVTDWRGNEVSLSMKGTVVATGDPHLHQELLVLLSND